jgi:hypothetical protein
VQWAAISNSNGNFYILPWTLIDFPIFLSMPMHFLVTASTKNYQIGFNVIALAAS